MTQTDNGKQVIVIQPANPQVVYVPQYNPQTVYVQSGPSTGDVVAASIISFGLGVAVGAMFSNNNYYYPRWGYGGVYYGGRPWVPRGYVYRPVYGPGWRPPAYYRPPANYPYHRPVHYNNNYYNSYRGGNNTVNINKTNNINVNRPAETTDITSRTTATTITTIVRTTAITAGITSPAMATTTTIAPAETIMPGNGNNNNRPGGNNGGTPGITSPATAGTQATIVPATELRRPPTGGATTRPAPDRGYAKPARRWPTPTRRPRGATRRVQAAIRPKRDRRRSQTCAAVEAGTASPESPGAGICGRGSGKSAQAASQRGAASNAGRNK